MKTVRFQFACCPGRLIADILTKQIYSVDAKICIIFGTRTEIKSCQESYDILKYQNKIQIFPPVRFAKSRDSPLVKMSNSK